MTEDPQKKFKAYFFTDGLTLVGKSRVAQKACIGNPPSTVFQVVWEHFQQDGIVVNASRTILCTL